MSETGPLARGLAGDCMVESAEGPVAMRDTPNKGFAVLTRLPSAPASSAPRRAQGLRGTPPARAAPDALPTLPASRRARRAGGAGEGRALPRLDVLGPARAGIRRPGGATPRRRTRAGRARG